MLIDIHTHSRKQSHLEFIVGIHSLGIHPWELNKSLSLDSFILKLKDLQVKLNPKVLAIGECGLDLRRKDIVDIKDQLSILSLHMDWAIETNRPLIIHCVKAQSDLLQLLKKKKYKGKILLHDFGGNEIQANAFLEFDSYFSFGKRLLNSTNQSSLVIKTIPLMRLFLETDDQEDIGLEDIYQQASKILNQDPLKLENILMENLVRFFSDLDDISSADLIYNLGHSS